MIVIGVDPGLTGALCIIGRDRQMVADIPTCENGTASGSMKRWVDVEKLGHIVSTWSHIFGLARESVTVVIERPIPMPSLPAQTIASQFDTFGALRAVLARYGDSLIVNPRDWKKIYGLGNDKSASRACAQRLYPALALDLHRVKDHNRAEAVLIAHYGLKEMQ